MQQQGWADSRASAGCPASPMKGKSPCSSDLCKHDFVLPRFPRLLHCGEAGPGLDTGMAAMTHLSNIFLEDSIETQLAHGVDRLPLLGFLGGHQQIGDFYGRKREKSEWSGEGVRSQSPTSPGPWACSTHTCAFVGSVTQQIFTKYLIPALQELISKANNRADMNQIIKLCAATLKGQVVWG